jgi:hypothetical protein
MANINQITDLELWIKHFLAVLTYKITSASFEQSYTVASVVCMAVHISSGAHFGNSVSIV